MKASAFMTQSAALAARSAPTAADRLGMCVQCSRLRSILLLRNPRRRLHKRPPQRVSTLNLDPSLSGLDDCCSGGWHRGRFASRTGSQSPSSCGPDKGRLAPSGHRRRLPLSNCRRLCRPENLFCVHPYVKISPPEVTQEATSACEHIELQSFLVWAG